MADVARLSDTAQRISAEPQRAARTPAQSSALAPKGRPHAGIGQTGQALVNAHRDVGGQAASARDEVEQIPLRHHRDKGCGNGQMLERRDRVAAPEQVERHRVAC